MQNRQAEQAEGKAKAMQNSIEKLQEIVDRYENLVFFGGAGVSTESGIPDFRSVDGLYNQKYDFPPDIRKNFINFTEIKCFVIQQSQMERI